MRPSETTFGLKNGGKLRNEIRHLDLSKHRIVCVSLATCTCIVWCNMLSRVCWIIECHFKRSVHMFINIDLLPWLQARQWFTRTRSPSSTVWAAIPGTARWGWRCLTTWATQVSTVWAAILGTARWGWRCLTTWETQVRQGFVWGKITTLVGFPLQSGHFSVT